MKSPFITLILATLLISACSGNEETNFDYSGSVEVLEISSTPAVDVKSRFSPTDEELVAAHNFASFGIDFVNTSIKEYDKQGNGDNAIVSPLSASVLLSMLANVCGDEARDQITEALGLEDIDVVNTLNAKIMYQLPQSDTKVNLSFGNGLWYDEGYTLNSSLLSVLGTYYDSEVYSGDFDNDREFVVGHINQWTNEKSKGLIKNIKDKIVPGEVAVLINTLYFDAKWRSKFDKAETEKAIFHGSGGDATVDMMNCFDMCDVRYCDDFTTVSKDYGNSVFEMMFILPAEGKPVLVPTREELEQATLSQHLVKIFLPRFEIAPSDRLDLSDVLGNMGISKIGEIADIRLFDKPISGAFTVYQKSYIKVDEEQTTAASATIGEMVTAPRPDLIRFDRPFAFMLRHKETGIVLFGGRVMNL